MCEDILMKKFTFEEAFVLTMLFEVGPWFDANDPACQAGKIDNKANRQKCGYVWDLADPGGETKFGVAQNHNPDVKIKTLTLEQAKAIYFKKYWLASKCDKLPTPVNACHFDAVTNHGADRAAKLLQKALGVTADGAIGPKTIAAINCADPDVLCMKMIEERDAFYHRLVAAKPALRKFLKGWLKRTETLRKSIK